MHRFSQLNIKAILIGLLVDFGSTTLVSFIFGTILAILIFQGMSLTDLQSMSSTDLEVLLVQRLQTSSGMLIATLSAGLGCTFLGGFVAARMANKLEFTHSGCVAAIVVMVSTFFDNSYWPVWYTVIGYLATIPIALLGGMAARIQRSSQHQ